MSSVKYDLKMLLFLPITVYLTVKGSW